MHGESLLRHVALGVYVAVEFPPGRDVMQQFDAGDLDDPVPVAGIEASGLGVNHDFPHCLPPILCRAAFPRVAVSCRSPATTRRNRRNVNPRPSPVGTTKSARRRFSRSGICARKMLAKRLSVMPGRRMTRSRCTRAGAETTST